VDNGITLTAFFEECKAIGELPFTSRGDVMALHLVNVLQATIDALKMLGVQVQVHITKASQQEVQT